MDVNETIVLTWLHFHSFFTINTIYYGQFHSDIDILALNLLRKEIWDIEVKVRTGSTKIMNGTDRQNEFDHFVHQLTSSERTQKIQEFVGDHDGFELNKVFVTTRSMLGSTDNQKKWTSSVESDMFAALHLDSPLWFA